MHSKLYRQSSEVKIWLKTRVGCNTLVSSFSQLKCSASQQA